MWQALQTHDIIHDIIRIPESSGSLHSISSFHQQVSRVRAIRMPPSLVSSVTLLLYYL